MEAFTALLDNKGLNAATIVFIASPDDNIAHRGVANPSLLTIEDVAALNFAGGGLETSCVATILRLGQTEAENFLELHAFGQKTFFLLIVTESIDYSHADSVVHQDECGCGAISFGDLIADSSRFESRQTRATIALDLESIDAERLEFIWEPLWELSRFDVWQQVLVNRVHHLACVLSHLNSTR